MNEALIRGLGYLVFIVWILDATAQRSDDSPCYDDQGTPEMCMPPWYDIAFGKTVTASNTCGLSEPQEYCVVGLKALETKVYIYHMPYLTHFIITRAIHLTPKLLNEDLVTALFSKCPILLLHFADLR